MIIAPSSVVGFLFTHIPGLLLLLQVTTRRMSAMRKRQISNCGAGVGLASPPSIRVCQMEFRHDRIPAANWNSSNSLTAHEMSDTVDHVVLVRCQMPVFMHLPDHERRSKNQTALSADKHLPSMVMNLISSLRHQHPSRMTSS